MATNTLNTRIILKGDTAANWANSTLVLLKNEIAIESDTRKVKIGDGTNVYADLRYINMTPEEINTLITALEEAKHTHDNKAILDATTASFTSDLLTKLNGIEENANNYTLPNATSSVLGGVKVGTNISVSSGTISVANGTTSAKGVVQLTNSTSSTSTTTAATPNSVKSAYDLANTAKTNADSAQTAANNAQTTADSKIGSVSLASGTNNGTLKLTVDGTATDNIAVKGLGTAAYTASSAYATAAQGTKADNAMPKSGGTFTGAVTLKADPTTDLGAATKQYVDTQITSKIAASDAMVFKGTLGSNGTVTAVPTTGVVKGDTYKVITAGTWAGSSCKIGDLLIALNSGSIEANSTNWAYVPSGNENETTIKYSTTTQNLTTSAKTGNITLAEGATKQVDSTIEAGSSSTNLPTSAAVATFVEGKGYTSNVGTITGVSVNSPLTGGGTSGSVTISHEDSGATAGSYGDSAAQTPAYGGTFKVPYVTVDAKGHVTGISAHTVKIPASDNTDTKVNQSSSTANGAYPLLASASTSPTSGSANTAVYNTGVTVNPSTKTITATTFKGALNGNASTASSAAKLTTARTIGLGTAVTATAQSFDGSGNITIPITGLNSDYLRNGSNTLIFDCGGAN